MTRQSEVVDVDTTVESASDVVWVELGPDRDAGEVDRLQPMREQGALETNHVPAEDLVTTRHGQQSFSGQNSVPGLDPLLLRKRN